MNWISEPWPWYVTAPLIGLVVLLLLYFGNKQFGISASFKDACAACLPIKPRYFQYDWKASVWRLPELVRDRFTHSLVRVSLWC
jgi:hypothetical protein